MRVIVVDDDATSRLTLSLVVKRLGHEAVVFEDGASALRGYEKRPAPVILSDWVMPEMTGADLCRAIRALKLNTYTYFIMVTSLSDRESSLEGFRAGADDFLVKPVHADELAARLSAAERVVRRSLAENESFLRDAIELSQQGVTLTRSEDGTSGDNGLSSHIGRLVDVYWAQDAYVKARAFLRRQIAIEEERGTDPARVAALRAELGELAKRDG